MRVACREGGGLVTSAVTLLHAAGERHQWSFSLEPLPKSWASSQEAAP